MRQKWNAAIANIFHVTKKENKLRKKKVCQSHTSWTTAIMGSCNSKICAESRDVTIHKRCNKMRLKQATAAGSTPKISCSEETIDIGSSDRSLSNSFSSRSSWSSISSENEGDMDLPEDVLQALEIRGTSCLPRKEADVRNEKQRKRFFPFGSKDRQLQNESKANQHDSRNSPPKDHSSAPAAPARHFSYTGPSLFRPSPWKEVYLTMIKPNEQLVEVNMDKYVQQAHEKKKRKNREEQIRALRKQLSRRFDSIKRKTSYIRRRNTPEERQSKWGVAHRDEDDGDEGSSTNVSPASTSSSSTSAYSSSIKSEDSFEEIVSSIGRYYRDDDESKVPRAFNTSLHQGKKNTGKSRAFFRGKKNKVSPM